MYYCFFIIIKEKLEITVNMRNGVKSCNQYNRNFQNNVNQNHDKVSLKMYK